MQSPNNATNPFLNSPAPSSHAPVDLFAAPVKEAVAIKASDDLLQLNNPFADVFGAQPVAAVPLQNNMWMTNGNGTKNILTMGQKPLDTKKLYFN